jgi:hypothetical protein
MPATYSQSYSHGNGQNDMPQNRQAYMLRGMELGDRITERLLALGISQAELAQRQAPGDVRARGSQLRVKI